MLDIGWQELLVIGALALIVVGPKDLPGLLRTLGQYAGKVRGMAREFQRTMDDAARQGDVSGMKELTDLRKDLTSATKFDFKEQAKRASDSLTNPPKVDSLGEFERVKKDPAPKPDPAPAPSPEPENSIAAPGEPMADDPVTKSATDPTTAESPKA